jgi:hypothetical protein
MDIKLNNTQFNALMREADKNGDSFIDIDEMIDIFLNDMDLDDRNSIEAIRNVIHLINLNLKDQVKRKTIPV